MEEMAVVDVSEERRLGAGPVIPVCPLRAKRCWPGSRPGTWPTSSRPPSTPTPRPTRFSVATTTTPPDPSGHNHQ
jgi:hypothetical protein